MAFRKETAGKLYHYILPGPVQVIVRFPPEIASSHSGIGATLAPYNGKSVASNRALLSIYNHNF